MIEGEFLSHKDDLVQLLRRSFQETLFTSRAFLRPTDLGRLASVEAGAFFDFLRCSDQGSAEALGAEFSRIGVGDEAVLRAGQVLRQFCNTYAPDDLPLDCLNNADEFQHAVLKGYFRAREANILEEQERIRSALQQTLHRYNLQIETAAEVARATISILDLGVLLTTSVDLIGERFGLDYVGIYLADAENRHAVLRAATGAEGRRRLAEEHQLALNGTAAVTRCMRNRQHVMASDAGDEFRGLPSPWLPNTHSEIALPLITRDVVIGALTVQSNRIGAFSSQDVPGFQIMADQLANAIENARLFADARRRADDLTVAYEQLKELEELKDQFMQNVSHELRTPLTMIQGYAEFMLTGTMGPITEDQADALRVMVRNSEALAELVTDILAMLEVNASKASLSPVLLLDVVKNSIKSFQIAASNAGVTLLAELGPDGSDASVMARPDHLRRIFDNLLNNALKFTPSNGQVCVRFWLKDRLGIVEVADTGIGIPQDLQPRVFDRFFQVDGTRQRRFGGTGLGLALVRELVESYQGEVTVASPGVDRGSTFTVVLPLV